MRSRSGLHPAPDLTMTFDSPEVAARIMRPGRDYLEFIDALKNFQMRVEGPDELAVVLRGGVNRRPRASIVHASASSSSKVMGVMRRMRPSRT